MANLEYMKFWIITPSGAINYVTNPTPYRSMTGYTAYGAGTTIAASDTYTRRGPACIKVTPTTSTSGVYFNGVPVSNGKTYTFSVDVKGESEKVMRIYIANGAGTARATTTFTATGNWQRLQVTWTATENQANYRLYVVRNATTGTTPFYVDGFQFEEGSEATTFFSGDTEGFADNDFYWNGLPHASTSTRSADTRAGGALLDIRDHAEIAGAFGFGMGNYQQVYNELVSGGALYQKHIRKPRTISLLLDYSGSWDEMHANRNAILEAVTPSGDMPIVIRYQGVDMSGDEATQPLDIVCIPQPSHQDTPDLPSQQRDVLTFTVLDGYLRGAYKEGVELGLYDTLTNANYFVMRDKDGKWSVPNNSGTGITGIVNAIAEAPNGDIYIGGNFTNAGGVAEADYLCKWDGNSITSVTGASDFTGNVNALAVDARGNLYIGGIFENVGDTNGDGIVMWDGASLSSLGTGTGGFGQYVLSLAVDPSTGYLYAGGEFAQMGGVTGAEEIAYWNGTSWNPLSSGLSHQVWALTFGADGNLYIGGEFLGAAGGGKGNYICKWNGSAFSALSATELLGYVYALSHRRSGNLYIMGAFINAGNDPNADYICVWNGANYTAVGTGINNPGLTLFVDIDDSVYAGGRFTMAGGIGTDKVSVYRGGAWQSLDINLPGAGATIGNVNTILVGQSRDLMVGGEFYGTAIAASQKTVTNSANINVYPTIEITGPGVLQGFSNFTTGASIQFDGLTLQPNEVLTINLDPTNLKMTSTWRGNCLRYVNAGSDLGDFYLKPGDNSITFFMPSGTDSNTKAYLYYTPAFWNVEGALL